MPLFPLWVRGNKKQPFKISEVNIHNEQKKLKIDEKDRPEPVMIPLNEIEWVWKNSSSPTPD